MAIELRSVGRVRALPAYWRGPLGGLLGALALLFAVFHETFWSLVGIWSSSGTFAHGFLIGPIALFLIWRQRGAVAPLVPRPCLSAAVLMAALGLAWLLGELVGVDSVRQFSVVLMIPALAWLLLGTAVVWQLIFPLGYLVFAVPFGAFLVEPLMVYTADFTVGMVRLSGVPVYREGMFFSLPSGHWSVVEACSGIRYLIASVALGALYAYMTYTTWPRRTLFMAAAVIVPIVANGLRAYMIVMIGHLSDMKLAVGVDHLLYGWVFFGIVIFLLFWSGSFWRETPAGGVQGGSTVEPSTGRSHGASLAGALMLASVVIMATPAYAMWIDHGGERDAPRLGALPEIVGAWQRTSDAPAWKPGYRNARDEWHALYRRGDERVGLYVGYYAEQSRHGEMIAWENTLAGQGEAAWDRLQWGSGPAGANRAQLGGPGGQAVVAWQWYWVDGRLTGSSYAVKGAQAVSRLLGGSDDAAHIVVFAPYGDDERAREVRPAMEAFTDEVLPVARRRLQEVKDR